MAVNFYRSATNPSGQQFTLRGLFACCYGGKGGNKSPTDEQSKDEMDLGDGSDESDEEIRQNFARARANSVARRQSSVRRTKTTEENGEAEKEKEEVLHEENETPTIFVEHDFSTPSEENALMEDQFAKYGILNITCSYDAKKEKLGVSVNQVKDIPTDRRAGTAHYQVRLTLLPAKKVRFKTKVRQGDSPFFEELFHFSKITREEAGDLSIRFRLYNVEKLRREKAVSETVFNLSSIDLEEEKTYNLMLVSSSALKSGYGTSESQLDLSSDAGSTTTSMASGTLPPGDPELLLGLTYNGTTGRLAVEVIKGSALRAPNSHKPPDSFVNVVLMSANGQTIAASKTTSRKGQPNPLFRETFMFQVAHFQLTDITLMVNVYNKKAMNRKEMIGWFSIGLNCSGEEELRHWQDMKEAQGEQVCRWHILQDSSTS